MTDSSRRRISGSGSKPPKKPLKINQLISPKLENLAPSKNFRLIEELEGENAPHWSSKLGKLTKEISLGSTRNLKEKLKVLDISESEDLSEQENPIKKTSTLSDSIDWDSEVAKRLHSLKNIIKKRRS